MERLYKYLDRQVEKLVFLFNAEKGNYGLYELVWELGRFEFLTIADKYAIAYDLLKELLVEDLIILEEHKDATFKIKIKNIEILDLEAIIHDPSVWYPDRQPMYSIAITNKGLDYLDNQNKDMLAKLENRLEIKKST